MLGNFAANLLLWCMLLLLAGWAQGIVGGWLYARRHDGLAATRSAGGLLSGNLTRRPQVCSACGSSAQWMVADEHERWG
jgi:hypothetical protein